MSAISSLNVDSPVVLGSRIQTNSLLTGIYSGAYKSISTNLTSPDSYFPFSPHIDINDDLLVIQLIETFEAFKLANSRYLQKVCFLARKSLVKKQASYTRLMLLDLELRSKGMGKYNMEFFCIVLELAEVDVLLSEHVFEMLQSCEDCVALFRLVMDPYNTDHERLEKERVLVEFLDEVSDLTKKVIFLMQQQDKLVEIRMGMRLKFRDWIRLVVRRVFQSS